VTKEESVYKRSLRITWPCDGSGCDGKIFFSSHSSKDGRFFFLRIMAYLL